MGTVRSRTWPLQKSWSGPHREGEESKPMKHGQEKSDLFIIALKPTNKPGRMGAELVELRERTEENMGEQHTYRTLRRIKRVPEARLCTRSCSWDSSLTTRGGSPVRESRPPGSVRGASSNGCPYRDRIFVPEGLIFSNTNGPSRSRSRAPYVDAHGRTPDQLAVFQGATSIEEIRFLWKILHGLHPSTRQHRDSGRLPKRGVETCRLVPPSGQVQSYRIQ